MLILFILAFAPYIHASNSFSDSNKKEQQTKKHQLKVLRQRMEQLRQKIEKKQNEKNSASKYLKDIEVRIGKRANTLNKINQRLRGQKREVQKLKIKQRKIKRKLSKQRAVLSEQIRSSYMMGKQAYIKLLLNQENPAVMGRALTYYDYFHKARSHNINEAIISIEKIKSLTSKIKTKTKKLNVLHKQQQHAKKKLEDDFLNRSIVVKAMEKDIVNKSKRLKQFVVDEQLLQQLLKDISNIMPSRLTSIDKRETFRKRRGRLKWPVQGKVKRIFGKSRQAANVKWNGVLIASKEGKDVKAISHGRVAYADWLRGYGMLMIVDHGDGYMTLYGYNQALYKETGDWVEEGEVIATVGRSGGQKKSGLYFEVRVKGKPSNPIKWCKS